MSTHGLLVTIGLLIALSGCRTVSNQRPYLQYRLDLSEAQVCHQLQFLDTNGARLEESAQVKRDIQVLQDALQAYLGAHLDEQPFVLMLRPDDPERDEPVMRLEYLNSAKETVRINHPMTVDNEERLRAILMEWQEAAEPMTCDEVR